MGHAIFVILHLLVLVAGGASLLLLTIPAHLIYAVAKAGRSAAPAATADAPTPKTHVRCPDCRELVRMDASKCKHCGCALVPHAVETH